MHPSPPTFIRTVGRIRRRVNNSRAPSYAPGRRQTVHIKELQETIDGAGIVDKAEPGLSVYAIYFTTIGVEIDYPASAQL